MSVAALRPPLVLPAPRSLTSRAVVAGAAGVAVLHAADAALVSRWDGQPLRTALPGALATALAATIGAVAWPRLPRGPRALAALVAGLLALVAGGLAVWSVSVGSTEGGAVTGLLLVPAGVALTACAVAALRGGPRRSPAHRWARRAGGAVAVAAALLLVVMPVGAALYVTGKPRLPVPAHALDAVAHEDVTFRSSDGLRLAGWYVPSHNGAAIVVVHGSGGNRGGAARHALMLARHGYGVLLYDARGRGESEGAPEGFGWTWQRDLAGALAFLKQRPDVDPTRIGGLGLSTGAEVLVQASARRGDLRAIVADGVEARTATETARVADPLETANFAVMTLANRVLADAGSPPDLGELVGRVRAPTLLIASGTGSEAAFGRIYRDRSHGRAQLWAIPDAAHTKGLRTHPAAYTTRVTRFFDAALLSRR